MRIEHRTHVEDDISYVSKNGGSSNTQSDEFDEKIVEQKPDQIDTEIVPDDQPGAMAGGSTTT